MCPVRHNNRHLVVFIVYRCLRSSVNLFSDVSEAVTVDGIRFFDSVRFPRAHSVFTTPENQRSVFPAQAH